MAFALYWPFSTFSPNKKGFLRKKKLRYQLLIIVIVSMYWHVYAQSISAQQGNAIGTHAAFFDYGNNIGIANLVKSKGGTLVTVMIDINAPVSEINSVLQATEGLDRIVRVVGVDHQASTDNSKAVTLAQNFNQSSIQTGTIVIFGNEVNNLDREWKLCPDTTCPQRTAEAATEYGAFYTAFKNAADTTKYIPVPSPLDMYNGVYTDFQTFMNTSGVYNDQIVANVYDVGNNGLESYTNYPNSGTQVIAFSEYGPHPNNTLQQHVEFYNTHTPPVKATTLVPNSCHLGNEAWLYYVNGHIFDLHGNEIDPTTCTIIVPPQPCPADITGDRKVDLADYVQFTLNFLKQPPPNTKADITGDGKVDLLDYRQLLLHFLMPCD